MEKKGRMKDVNNVDDHFTCQLFHPVTLASTHMVVDYAENVAKQVTGMLGSDRGADRAVWLSLRAPAPPEGHVAAQHGQGDLSDVDVRGLASSSTSTSQLSHFP